MWNAVTTVSKAMTAINMTAIKSVLLLAALCGGMSAQADPAPDQSAALHFLDDFYAALKQHDASALSGMIAGTAPVVVLFDDGDGEQTFTLSKAEYLQQVRAVWHFASDESYSVKDISYHAAASAGAPAVVSLVDSESRTILDNPSGQRNRMEISLAATQGRIMIVAIKTHTVIW